MIIKSVFIAKIFENFKSLKVLCTSYNKSYNRLKSRSIGFGFEEIYYFNIKKSRMWNQILNPPKTPYYSYANKRK